MSYIEIKNLYKSYKMGEVKVDALNDMSLNIEEGELVVILGPSGTGKSTLLNALGGVDTVDSGTIIVDGREITKLSNNELILYRRNDIGFVFQQYSLIQNLSALENVKLAVTLKKSGEDPEEILEKVGLGSRINHYPSQMSGGEQQRVAIARAIVKKPKILICDEPTGALDYASSKQVLKLLEDASRKDGNTVIIVTHNSAIGEIADKIFKIHNGTVKETIVNENPKTIDEIWW